MLQQTQVKTVIPYWERWLRELPDIAALADASEDRVLKLWEGLGYYSRARNLRLAARVVRERHGGRFPRELTALRELPGIGPYTAGAIASIAFNQPAPILDGNVIRILTRLGALRGNPREKRLNQRLWKIAEDVVAEAARIPGTRPGRNCSDLNQALMELGATVCSPQTPACSVCSVADHCVAHRLRQEEKFPQTALRPAVELRRFVVVVLLRDRRLLVQQRPSGVVNAGLWEFPQLELTDPTVEGRSAAAGWLKLKPARFDLLPAIRHSITRYRIHLEVVRARLGRPRVPVEGKASRWVTPAELDHLTLTAAHRRIARWVAPTAESAVAQVFSLPVERPFS